jgi:hypothetical protein
VSEWGDWSGPSPSPQALRDNGISGAIRYIGDGNEGKQIHAAEVKRYTDALFPYALVTELSTVDAWVAADDFAAGKARAERALADARAEGIPDYVPIAWAADAHANPDQVQQALNYGRGFQSVLGKRTGVYGFIEVVRAAHDAGLGYWWWLAGSMPSAADQKWLNFWQRNDKDSAITISGTVVDRNRVLNPIGVIDTMSDVDAYKGVKNLILDMTNGDQPDLAKRFGQLVWDVALAEPDVPENDHAEARLAMLSKRVLQLTADMATVKAATATTNVTLSITSDQLNTLIKGIANQVVLQLPENGITKQDVHEVVSDILGSVSLKVN